MVLRVASCTACGGILVLIRWIRAAFLGVIRIRLILHSTKKLALAKDKHISAHFFCKEARSS